MDTEVCKMWGSYARGPVDSPFGQRRASWRNGNYSFSIREVILFPSRMFWRKKKKEKNQKIEGIFSPCNKKEQLSILKPIDAGLDGL